MSSTTEAISLSATARTISGKQVKQLRHEGLVPGVVYGPTVSEPVHVQVAWTALRPTLIKARSTEIIALDVDGQSINVLVRQVQRHPVRGDVLHVDFYAVDVNREIRTSVPVVVLNAEATGKRLGARVLQMVTAVEIETLPGNIPSHIDLDLSDITRPGAHISIRDLPQIEGVTYLDDEETVVVRTVSLSELEEEAERAFVDEPFSPEVEVIRRRDDNEDEE